MAVPPEITEWLAFHRQSLPEPPFQMTLVTTAMGVTTAGDEIATNALPYLLVVQEDRVIEPSSGTPSQPTSDVQAGDGAGDTTSSDAVSDESGVADSGQGDAETM